MTEINTIYKPIWGEWLGEGDDRRVQICKATDWHYGRYTTYGSMIPTWKVDSKEHLGYVVMVVEDELNNNTFTTRKQPIHHFNTKRMSDKLAIEWDVWVAENSVVIR
jgi:hypothetical protein